MAPVLYGFRFSVYVRIARVVLAEKGVPYELVEIDPFAEDMPLSYLDLHPFRRVPALVHDGFQLYETQAITRYIDEAFDGPSLQPGEPMLRARMAQIIAIADSYGYRPMVREVFAQRVFAPAAGRAPDEVVVREGLARSHQVLGALERLAQDGGPLAGGERLSLADFHLAPMVAYFTAAPEGRDALAQYGRLSAWWAGMQQRESLGATEPGLPKPGA